MDTPWGPTISITRIADGIIWCETASHGGYWLSAKRRAEMPAAYRNFKTFAGGNWYEKDCDWTIVVLAFEQEFLQAKQLSGANYAKHVQGARDMIESNRGAEYYRKRGVAIN